MMSFKNIGVPFDPEYIVHELSANPVSNCALHYIVTVMGGKIVIPVEAFEDTRRKLKDKSHPLIAFYDEKDGIVLQVI